MTWTQLLVVSGLSYLICVIFKFECTIVQQMKCAMLLTFTKGGIQMIKMEI